MTGSKGLVHWTIETWRLNLTMLLVSSLVMLLVEMAQLYNKVKRSGKVILIDSFVLQLWLKRSTVASVISYIFLFLQRSLALLM